MLKKVSLLSIALSFALLTGCVKNEESEGVKDLRAAKAEEIKANAEYQKASAAVKTAEAAYKNAETALETAKAAQQAAETAWYTEWANIQKLLGEQEVAGEKAKTDALVAAQAAAAAKSALEQAQHTADLEKLAVTTAQALAEAKAKLLDAYNQALMDSLESVANLTQAQLDAAKEELDQKLSQYAKYQEDLFGANGSAVGGYYGDRSAQLKLKQDVIETIMNLAADADQSGVINAITIDSIYAKAALDRAVAELNALQPAVGADVTAIETLKQAAQAKLEAATKAYNEATVKEEEARQAYSDAQAAYNKASAPNNKEYMVTDSVNNFYDIYLNLTNYYSDNWQYWGDDEANADNLKSSLTSMISTLETRTEYSTSATYSYPYYLEVTKAKLAEIQQDFVNTQNDIATTKGLALENAKTKFNADSVAYNTAMAAYLAKYENLGTLAAAAHTAHEAYLAKPSNTRTKVDSTSLVAPMLAFLKARLEFDGKAINSNDDNYTSVDSLNKYITFKGFSDWYQEYYTWELCNIKFENSPYSVTDFDGYSQAGYSQILWFGPQSDDLYKNSLAGKLSAAAVAAYGATGYSDFARLPLTPEESGYHTWGGSWDVLQDARAAIKDAQDDNNDRVKIIAVLEDVVRKAEWSIDNFKKNLVTLEKDKADLDATLAPLLIAQNEKESAWYVAQAEGNAAYQLTTNWNTILAAYDNSQDELVAIVENLIAAIGNESSGLQGTYNTKIEKLANARQGLIDAKALIADYQKQVEALDAAIASLDKIIAEITAKMNALVAE